MHSRIPEFDETYPGPFPLRAGLAFVLAPLAPTFVAALIEGHIAWVLVFAPFAYFFALAGIPAFWLCYRCGWVTAWQVVAISAFLGALVSLLFDGFRIPSWSDIGLFAGYGALTGFVFWVIAFAGARPSNVCQ
jgi:hypothetical protein